VAFPIAITIYGLCYAARVLKVKVDTMKYEFPIGLVKFFFVTICPETFSNLCVDSVRDM